MAFMTMFFLFLCFPSLTVALDDRRDLRFWPRASTRKVPEAGYYDPNSNSGSMLTQVTGTFPPGQGEPLNAILSGNSDEAVLIDSENKGGLRNYFLSFGFSGECLGQHGGSDQLANLGDGNGYLNETAVIRWDYHDPELGSCTETIQGGNHFRYWVQNGAQGNSTAVFMAVSSEKPIAQQHDIVMNGYNLGRDWMIGNMTNQTIPSGTLTNTSTFSGSTSWAGYTYETTVNYVSGLLSNTSIGINHNATVGVNGANAIDGLVGVITVKITSKPPHSAAWRPSPIPSWNLPFIFLLIALSLPVFISF